MKLLFMAPRGVVVALLLLGGCGASPVGDTVVAADQDRPPSADVARPPEVADSANQAEAEPLNDAGEIASEIASNTMIARVPVDGGLAWLQDGEVVRTASQDGRRVAYFHPGERRPFLVQEGAAAFAYRDGRAQLAYDRAGHPERIPAAAQARAERLAAEARREREAAEQILPGGGEAGDGNREE